MKNVHGLKASLTPMLCVALCLLMLFSAVACNGKKNTEQETQGNATGSADVSGNEQNPDEISEQELNKPAEKDYDRDLNIYSQGNYSYFSETDGYTGEISGDAATGFVLTNTLEIETTEISVAKVWVEDRKSVV